MFSFMKLSLRLLASEFLCLSIHHNLPCFSFLHFTHNSLHISNVAIHIEFPLAPSEVHVSYLPKYGSLFPALETPNIAKGKEYKIKYMFLVFKLNIKYMLVMLEITSLHNGTWLCFWFPRKASYQWRSVPYL